MTNKIETEAPVAKAKGKAKPTTMKTAITPEPAPPPETKASETKPMPLEELQSLAIKKFKSMSADEILEWNMSEWQKFVEYSDRKEAFERLKQMDPEELAAWVAAKPI